MLLNSLPSPENSVILPSSEGGNRLLTKSSDVYSLGMVILHVNCTCPLLGHHALIFNPRSSAESSHTATGMSPRFLWHFLAGILRNPTFKTTSAIVRWSGSGPCFAAVGDLQDFRANVPVRSNALKLSKIYQIQKKPFSPPIWTTTVSLNCLTLQGIMLAEIEYLNHAH